jgi:hypothetical protein
MFAIICRLVTDQSINTTLERALLLDAELVSPVLKGRQGLAEVARVLTILNTLPIEVNETTALHIHVSQSSGLTSATVACTCNALLAGLCLHYIGACSIAGPAMLVTNGICLSRSEPSQHA